MEETYVHCDNVRPSAFLSIMGEACDGGQQVFGTVARLQGDQGGRALKCAWSCYDIRLRNRHGPSVS